MLKQIRGRKPTQTYPKRRIKRVVLRPMSAAAREHLRDLMGDEAVAELERDIGDPMTLLFRPLGRTSMCLNTYVITHINGCSDCLYALSSWFKLDAWKRKRIAHNAHCMIASKDKPHVRGRKPS
jgi:hypothetical protein